MILSTETSSLQRLVSERETIEILAGAGFDALDYTFSPWMESGDSEWNGSAYREHAKLMRRIAADHGVYFNQAHSPFRYQMDKTELRYIVDQQARCLECCAIMGIPHAVVHPLHHLPYKANHDLVWNMNLEYYHLLQPYAKQFGVRVCLENMFGKDPRRGTVPDMFCNPQEYAAFYDLLDDRSCFTCCVDTGHSGLTDEDAANTIRVMGDRVHALHINDNKFRDDEHLVPYQGLIDWDSVLKALADTHYSGDFTFEALHIFKNFDQEFYPTAAKYLHDVGRYMIARLEKFAKEG